MKAIRNLLSVFTLFVLTSCAPKVITDIVKVYPVTTRMPAIPAGNAQYDDYQ